MGLSSSGSWAPESGPALGRATRVGVAAVAVGGAVGVRASYPVLFIDPVVDVVVGGSAARRIGTVQGGAIGLAAEAVPQPPPGQQHNTAAAVRVIAKSTLP